MHARKLLVSVSSFVAVVSLHANADQFTAVGPMLTPRLEHTSTLLLDGSVLIAGGQGDDGTGTLPSAEIYDPTTRSFSQTAGGMSTIRTGHQAIRLQDGRVLIVGGGNIFTDPPVPAEIYDPATSTFSDTGAPIAERYDFNAALLPDGRVVIAGGQGCCKDFSNGSRMNVSLDSVEIYDPVTQIFSAASPLGGLRGYAASTSLADGRFLVTGGKYDSYDGDNFLGTFYLDSADVFDLSSMSFQPIAAPMTIARSNHNAALLPDGEVLVAFSGRLPDGSSAPASAERFDPTTGTFSASVTPPGDRLLNNLSATLQDGRVLLAGGFDPSVGTTDGALLYDPVQDAYALSDATMTTPRNFHRLTTLSDGTVLITGGWDTHFTDLASAELFIPAITASDVIFTDGFDVPPAGGRSSAKANTRHLPSPTNACSVHAVMQAATNVARRDLQLADGKICRSR